DHRISLVDDAGRGVGGDAVVAAAVAVVDRVTAVDRQRAAAGILAVEALRQAGDRVGQALQAAGGRADRGGRRGVVGLGGGGGRDVQGVLGDGDGYVTGLVVVVGAAGEDPVSRAASDVTVAGAQVQRAAQGGAAGIDTAGRTGGA